MKKIILTLIIFSSSAFCEKLFHNIKAEINPQKKEISMKDTLTFEEPKKQFIFLLNENLSIKEYSHAAIKALSPEEAKEMGIENTGISAKIYLAYAQKPFKTFSISYEGAIDHGFEQISQEYSRSFSESLGIISSTGVYLSGQTSFYPTGEDFFHSFSIEIKTPPAYSCVSNGKRLKKTLGKSVWEETKPLDEITISCADFKEYSIFSKGKTYYAFLLKEDENLANKYLEASAKFTEFYSSLLGDYPYEKFALVENFWDTGYGLPSFTLLGSKVIRLPFILSSSYPHEILHNWFGNGVFVNYEKGNWCEGLTVYLADYLIKENARKDKEYRRATLQKYKDYAQNAKDFPLSEFTSRHSSAQEAVGYGKSMMFYHMLRLKLGDEIFIKGLKNFYSKNIFKKASFEDLKNSFEETSNLNLSSFFEDWTKKTGALDLSAENVILKSSPTLSLEFSLTQKNNSFTSTQNIPITLYFTDGTQKIFLPLSKTNQNYSLNLKEKPLCVAVDADLDLFRKLYNQESPAVFSKVLGAEKPLIILPSKAKEEKLAAYTAFAKSWNLDKTNIPEIIYDNELKNIPNGKSAWILGRENIFFALFEKSLSQNKAKLKDNFFYDSNQTLNISSKTIVISATNAGDENSSLNLIESDSSDFSSLFRKLPHYGKYSWLIFDSKMNLENSSIWETSNSPLKKCFDGQTAENIASQNKPLATIPSFFSKENLNTTLKKLSVEIKERYISSEGSAESAEYIINSLKKAGIKPYKGKYIHRFNAQIKNKKIKASNILGVLQGKTKPREFLILSAHYDHLKSSGAISYPGANDNASGVALLMELARYYSQKTPERSLIFAFFDAEEENLQGSSHFLGSMDEKSLANINACLNFDNIGALNKRKILILSADSSSHWQHIFRGAGFVTQTDYTLSLKPLDSSDQISFINKKIPGIQFFDGGDLNYHKPTDTFEKIDFEGIIKIGEFAKEAIDYLASSAPFIPRPDGTLKENKEKQERKVFTGLVPDFSYSGVGVKFQDVSFDSPFEKAGLIKEDVLLEFAGQAVTDLSAYSQMLKKSLPGDKIKILYLRAGEKKEAEIILQEKK